MNKDKDSFFWQTQAGKLPIPKCANTLGAKFIEINTEAGTIQMEFDGKEAFTNPTGNIQGGFLAAMLDDTMGPALVATLKASEFAPTIDLNIQFFKPAKVGKIQAFGKIEKKGKTICYLSGELRQNDKVIAKATASAIIRKIETEK